MSVNAANGSYQGFAGGRPAAPNPPEAPRSPFKWARQRLAARPTRRISAAGQRAEQRLAHLAPAWRVVDWLPPTSENSPEQSGFLAIGPGGVYAVTVVEHGRQRVMVAGDVIQIQGRRPPYVARARKAAKKASEALTAAVGTTVPVVPVLAFVGSGSLSAQGLPTGCLLVPHRDLDRLLLAAGNKISTTTAKKLADVASHPATWADQYRWYPDNQTASDKRSARR
ncbi:MAG TPA: hypothetical protein VIL37_12970 [Natronosporangium sp.]